MPEKELMGRALALARSHNPAPNPRVGAVIVKDGRITGEGAHRMAGEPHAEVVALRSAGAAARGAELYVTLEPCSHSSRRKRTPPCTKQIIESGIKRVFIASVDPNPEVSGSGISALRDSGVEVLCGILEDEERLLNPEYHHFHRTGRPWIHLKQAVSLDGCIAEGRGCKTRLSCGESMTRVHRLREAHQGILCGGATVITDNPELTARRGGGRTPIRLILEGREPIYEDAKVFDTASAQTVLYTACTDPGRLERLDEAGVQIVGTAEDSLRTLIADTAARGIISILAEAGGKLAAALLREELADELSFFYVPVLLGDGVPMAALTGADLRSRGWTSKPPVTAGSDVIMNWSRMEAGRCLPV